MNIPHSCDWMDQELAEKEQNSISTNHSASEALQSLFAEGSVGLMEEAKAWSVGLMEEVKTWSVATLRFVPQP